jgi:hypothetical protein
MEPIKREPVESIRQQEPEEIFTPEEAAQFFKVSKTTLDNWRNGRTQKNPLPVYGQGKVVRYLKSNCIKFLMQHRM